MTMMMTVLLLSSSSTSLYSVAATDEMTAWFTKFLPVLLLGGFGTGQSGWCGALQLNYAVDGFFRVTRGTSQKSKKPTYYVE